MRFLKARKRKKAIQSYKEAFGRTLSDYYLDGANLTLLDCNSENVPTVNYNDLENPHTASINGTREALRFIIAIEQSMGREPDIDLDLSELRPSEHPTLPPTLED